MNLFGSTPRSRVTRPGFEDPFPSKQQQQSIGGRASYDDTTSYNRVNDHEYYTSKKKKEDDKGTKRAFYPITEEWQREKAKAFKIKMVESFKYGTTKSFYDKTPPSQTIPVQGDGNCFFRAISMCITGSENEHMRVRELITKHVEENPETYRTFLQSRGGMNQYLRVMRRSREWATDVEILAAATLLRTVIEVYFPCRINGHTEYRWQTFKPLNNENMTHPVIYLSNKNDHFDPVLDITAEVETEDERRQMHQSYSETPKSVRDSESHHDPKLHAQTLPSRNNHESSFQRVIPSHPGFQTYSGGQLFSRDRASGLQF